MKTISGNLVRISEIMIQTSNMSGQILVPSKQLILVRNKIPTSFYFGVELPNYSQIKQKYTNKELNFEQLRLSQLRTKLPQINENLRTNPNSNPYELLNRNNEIGIIIHPTDENLEFLIQNFTINQQIQ